MVLSLVFVSSRAGAAQGTVRIASTAAGIGLEAGVTLSAVDVGPPGLGAWTLDISYDPAVVSVVETVVRAFAGRTNMPFCIALADGERSDRSE